MKLPKIEKTPLSLPYPETTMFGVVEASANRHPEAPAIDFMGKITTYKDFVKKIELTAGAFYKHGIKKNDVVTICMPNTPQAVICLYALNRIGAVANMVHPLSSQKNITFYIDYSESKMILTLDQFYSKVEKAVSESEHKPEILTARIQEELPLIKAVAYKYLKNRENLKYPGKGGLVWADFVKTGKDVKLPAVEFERDKTAVILYSGGTSGTPKGILLSDYNFNALGVQIAEIAGCRLDYGCKFLSVMPVFHGFGLGIGIHTVLQNCALSILIPQFTKESYAKAVIDKKPNFIAGVPTLYEALLKVDIFKGKDLSFLIGVFSGGDSLSPELKKRADAFLKEHGAGIQIREGYGLTECVTASCLTPQEYYREGSIGVPFPDVYYKIVVPDSFDEAETGELGEICISGPTLMAGYLNEPKETAKTLQIHEDGRTWLHTGDLGYMDEDGFVYFKQRLKRMIVTSGYNVYPSQIENVIDSHEAVMLSTVIGVKDEYRMQRIKAYIVLKPGYEANDMVKDSIRQLCEKNIAKYALPREYEFRDSLPKTLVGKVAYTVLEKEENEKAEKLKC